MTHCSPFAPRLRTDAHGVSPAIGAKRLTLAVEGEDARRRTLSDLHALVIDDELPAPRLHGSVRRDRERNRRLPLTGGGASKRDPVNLTPDGPRALAVDRDRQRARRPRRAGRARFRRCKQRASAGRRRSGDTGRR
jgi:hypothetical protein